MTWTTAEVLAWVGELETRRASMSLFEVLGVTATATELGAAFHRLASGAHPDQHRLALTPVDMERLVRAYSLVTLAYATLRDPRQRALYVASLPTASLPTISARATPAAGMPSPVPAPRAQIYFRKGEAAWRNGDLTAALFNLRLAVVADPSSAQLQAALAQVQAEAAASRGKAR